MGAGAGAAMEQRRVHTWHWERVVGKGEGLMGLLVGDDSSQMRQRWTCDSVGVHV